MDTETLLVMGNLILAYGICYLKYYHDKFYILEATCVSCRTSGGRGRTSYIGTYKYYAGGMWHEVKQKEVSGIKPKVNKTCFVYVSKDNPEIIMPYSEKKVYTIFVVVGIYVNISAIIGL